MHIQCVQNIPPSQQAAHKCLYRCLKSRYVLSNAHNFFVLEINDSIRELIALSIKKNIHVCSLKHACYSLRLTVDEIPSLGQTKCPS